MNKHSAVTASRTPQSRRQQTKQASEQVRVEISADKLRELVNMGALCAGDMHCLDCESKQCLWRICLRACSKHFSVRSLPA